MSAYRDAREALEAIADKARQEVTAEAERLDPSAYPFVIEAVDCYARAVHCATSEATALAVEGVEETAVVAHWEQRVGSAQSRLSDAVNAALAVGAS